MAAPPMGLTELAVRIAAQDNEDIRWRLLLGFLDEFRTPIQPTSHR